MTEEEEKRIIVTYDLHLSKQCQICEKSRRALNYAVYHDNMKSEVLVQLNKALVRWLDWCIRSWNPYYCRCRLSKKIPETGNDNDSSSENCS